MSADVRRELLKAVEVIMMLGVPKSSFYDLIHEDPYFPRARRLGARGEMRWLRSEVEAYMNLLPTADRPKKPQKKDRAGS